MQPPSLCNDCRLLQGCRGTKTTLDSSNHGHSRQHYISERAIIEAHAPKAEAFGYGLAAGVHDEGFNRQR